MTHPHFPDLDPQDYAATRDALHAYSRILSGWMTSCRAQRKHWWHASLRPSLVGVTTGVIHADVDFEIELNIRESALCVATAVGKAMREDLYGQSAGEVSAKVGEFLNSAGVSIPPEGAVAKRSPGSDASFPAYSAEVANKLARVLSGVSAALTAFRAGIREETSPIGLWPHHFDLAMLWLPGDKVAGQNPADEESADKQMNFGFTFGDEGIPEAYFYVTAYPLPEGFSEQLLPARTEWYSEGFNGALLRYGRLLQEPDPARYLVQLWEGLVAAGRAQLRA
jgi:hypothetical protein